MTSHPGASERRSDVTGSHTARHHEERESEDDRSENTLDPKEIRERVDSLDWDQLNEQLDTVGHAITPVLLEAGECAELASLFDDGKFRSTIDMARYRFGDGRYRYFDHPLPQTIAALRTSVYAHLAPVANRWSEVLRGERPTWPLKHEDLIAQCEAAGQHRPTPLILRYHEGDWNALHQDLYGEVYFPFQILTTLSERDATSRAASSCCSNSARAPRAAPTCSPRPAARS